MTRESRHALKAVRQFYALETRMQAQPTYKQFAETHFRDILTGVTSPKASRVPFLFRLSAIGAAVILGAALGQRYGQEVVDRIMDGLEFDPQDAP